MRLAIVTSHPIQYQAPWFRALAAKTDLEVFFCHRQDEKGQADAGYGTTFEWDVPLLDGYQHAWLENVSPTRNVFTFRGCDTPEIGARLAAGRFDACIVNGWYLKSYVQAILACRRLGIPVFLRGDSQRATDRPLLTRALKYPLYRTLLNAVDGHLYVGQANRQYLAHYGVPSSRLWFVPHSVDDRWFRNAAAQAQQEGRVAEIRRRFGVSERSQVALFVGRLVDKKRPADFVRAIARVRESRDIVGLVVGSGPLLPDIDALSRQLGAAVRFAGFTNQSVLPAFYAASQVLVLPSDAGETWGLVANEALACGTPIVVSNRVGCSLDLVGPGTGRTFEFGNVEALASAIGDVSAERAARPDVVAQATRSISTRYGSVAAADATVEALKHALADSRPAVQFLPGSSQS